MWLLIILFFFILMWVDHLSHMRKIDKEFIKQLQQDKEFWQAYAKKLLKDKDNELEL